MAEQKIDTLRRIAHDIDPSINLFEGYSPKKMNEKKGEILFWRQIVNIYGLFADCDRVQVKEKDNLVELFNRYDLIARSEYDDILKFWKDVSELRKWFCHNNDEKLFYPASRKRRIKKYLNDAFLFASNKPTGIEEVSQNDWNLLNFNIQSRFENYLQIVEKALKAWKISGDLSDLIDEWINIQSKALFSDRELIQNALAEIAEYEKMNNGISNMSASQLANSYFRQLENGDFSDKNIACAMKNNSKIRSNKEIVQDAIRLSGII